MFIFSKQVRNQGTERMVLENESHKPSSLILVTHQYKHLMNIHNTEVALQSDLEDAGYYHSQTLLV